MFTFENFYLDLYVTGEVPAVLVLLLAVGPGAHQLINLVEPPHVGAANRHSINIYEYFQCFTFSREDDS